MKVSAITYIIITTLLLLTVTIFATMGFPFGWVFYSMVFGQVFWVLTVIRVLKDKYTTDKTFDDLYEDYPIGRAEKNIR